MVNVGASTNGKSGDFGSPIWRFESSRPSQTDLAKQIQELRVKSEKLNDMEYWNVVFNLKLLTLNL